MSARILNLPLSVTPEESYPFLGVGPDKLTPPVADLITHFLQTVSRLAAAQGVWADFPVSEAARDRITLQGASLVIAGENTVAHFASSDRITLFAVTIGKQVDALLEEISRKEPARTLILDGVASAAAEHAATQLDSLISGEIRHCGFFPTARFSPGYGDWPLMWQRPFLDSIGAERINLTCTPHFLLQPVKSVTAAIGWSRIPVERGYSLPERKKACQGAKSCQQCRLTDCPDRV